MGLGRVARGILAGVPGAALVGAGQGALTAPLPPQYPVRPASMTYDDIPHLSAKIKPKQQKVGLPSEGEGVGA